MGLSFNGRQIWSNQLNHIVIVAIPKPSILMLNKCVVVTLVGGVALVNNQRTEVILMRFLSVPVLISDINLVVVID